MNLLPILLLLLTTGSVGANEPVQLNFAVVALVKESSIRAAFEDALVHELQKAKFGGARVSHTHVELSGSTVSRNSLMASLEQLNLHGALVIRPLAVGPNAERETLGKVSQPIAESITDFLATTDRDPKWSAAVQVGAFLVTDEEFGDGEPLLFWRGVSWTDDGPDRGRAIQRLAEVIASNASQARAKFRLAQSQRGDE